MAYDLQSRLSSKVSSNVEVTYSIADAAFVEEYNAKYGKEYLPFMTASFSSETTNIAAGEIYSDIVKLQLSGLDNIEVGNTYLLPVRVQTGDVPVIDGADIAYYVIKNRYGSYGRRVSTIHSSRYPSHRSMSSKR